MRHGECDANVEHRIPAQFDSLLTKKGKKDAQLEGDMIARNGIKIDHIVSSPLSRAYETARIVAKCIGYETKNIEVNDMYSERNFGSLAGINVDEMSIKCLEKSLDVKGESYENFSIRVQSALKYSRQIAVGKVGILIIGHGGWFRASMTVVNHGNQEYFMQTNDPPHNKIIELITDV